MTAVFVFILQSELIKKNSKIQVRLKRMVEVIDWFPDDYNVSFKNLF